MTKPVLIFLHGGPGFRDYLKPYFSELNMKFTTVFYDQIQKADLSIDDLIHQLDHIVASHSGKIILIGHSWGGVLAAEYTLRFQKKISGLILMNTGLCFDHWKSGTQDVLTEDEKEIGLPFLDETWKTFSEESFDSLYENYIKTHDLREGVSLLKIPVLSILGEYDHRFPLKLTMPNLKSAMISNAGHFPFLNHATEIQAVIEKFAES